MTWIVLIQLLYSLVYIYNIVFIFMYAVHSYLLMSRSFYTIMPSVAII